MKNIRGVLRFILAGLGAVALVLPWTACSDPFGEYNNSNDPNFSSGTVTTVLVVIPTPGSTTSTIIAVGPVIQTVLGTGEAGNPIENQLAQGANITAPTGLSIPGDGNVYVALRGSGSMNHSFIVKIPAISTPTSKVNIAVGGGSITCTSLEAVGDIKLGSSSGVSVFESQIFVADRNNNRILKAEPMGIAPYAGTGSSVIVEGIAPRLSDIGFIPDLLYSDVGGGAVYYIEYNSHRIRKIVGDSIEPVVGVFNTPQSGDTFLNTPQALAMGPDGLYVADTGNNVIKRVVGSTMITVAGNGTAGGTFVEGGAATLQSLTQPNGVAVDTETGDVYIADTGTHRVLKVNKLDGTIRTIAGTGEQGFSGDNIDPESAKLNFPERLAVTRIDNKVVLYISDTGNHRVRRIVF